MEKLRENGVRQAKRKRVSKKNKSAWRKHSDIKDIENFLEDQRRQERTGGLVSEKTNDELFFVDSTPKRAAEPDKQDSEISRKRSKLTKALKCHASLLPDPNIKPARISNNAQVGFKKRPKWKQEQISSGVVSKKHQEATKQKNDVKAQKLQQRKSSRQPNTGYDLWSENPDHLAFNQPVSRMLIKFSGTYNSIKKSEDDVAEYHNNICKVRRVKPPTYYNKKPSVVPNIEVAAPGASYNPTYEDHQNLLAAALKVEEKKVKEEERILRALDYKWITAEEVADPNEDPWMRQWKEQTLDNEDDDDDDDDDEEGESRISCNPAVRREDKKTEKQRKTIQEQKQKIKATAQAKKENVRKQEIFRLKSLKRQVRERESMLAARQEARQQKKELNKSKPKKIGKLRFVEPVTELKLSNELEGSLRLLKPEGHVLEDRFKSLQKRNIIEPRQRARRTRKLKTKEFEKKGHKKITE